MAFPTLKWISCWGNDSYALAEPPDDAYLSVSIGTYAACGVNALHELRCWGLHLAGVDNAPSGSFREVKVSRGVHDSCAIHTDGSVACWNWDNTAAVPPADTFARLAVGARHACGVTDAATMRCWGENALGAAPDSVPGSYQDVGAGSDLSCGLTTAGDVHCWGYHAVDHAGPFAHLFVAADVVCGQRANGTLVCWGGSGYTGVIAPPATPYGKVAIGDAYGCGVALGSGSLECWGGIPYPYWVPGLHRTSTRVLYTGQDGKLAGQRSHFFGA